MMGGVEGGLGLVRAGVAARELRAVVAGDIEETRACWLPASFDGGVDRCQPA